ncbi:MAG TPA: hypothetical protein VHB50_14540, partial [Bryobacteraceae bacterium]|nr:hypothetical protein [Bryobacteraceae bacterium]
MKLAFLIFLFTLTTWAGDKVQIERDGGNWKVTVSGSLPPQPIYRVTTAGDLTVRGKPSREIHYSMTGKVDAPDEAAVRRVAAELQARAVNGQLYFAQPVSVRLELPRATRMLALWSTGGAIDASGLEGSVQATTAAGQITLDRIGG